MDPVSAVYYALVCAALAGTVPAGARPWVRWSIGAGVGFVAGALLPPVRGAVWSLLGVGAGLGN